MTGLSHCFRIAVPLALTMLWLSTCGAASPSPSPTPQIAGVQGKAMIVGGPGPGSPRPEPGVMVAVHQGDRHGTIVARTKADSSGAFRVDLPPGTYTLIEVSDAAMPQTVTVEPGKYVKLTLTIQAR